MKPIIFSTYSVRAIQDGRKTQTRRVIKPQPPDWCESFGFSALTPKGKISGRGTASEGYGEIFIKLIYQPGDIIWVKEKWRVHKHFNGLSPKLALLAMNNDVYGCIDYATNPRKEDFWGEWRSSRFMPKKAARLFLLVKSVSVERLQDITEKDARAEGVDLNFEASDPNVCKWQNYRDAYRAFWDKLNAKRGFPFKSNSWVWKYVFERTENPNGF